MNCEQIKFGKYSCAYAICLPWKVNGVPKVVSIDKCLLPEILQLWEQGIKTTGCCCGHGKATPYIGVLPEYINRMKEMGYQVLQNPCRPEDEDSFIPKTSMQYGEIEKGFNSWDYEPFPDDPMPVNTLQIKWRRKYPPVPRPEYSQVCDGYSCMWCDRCPRGEGWECPEEDKLEYKEYERRFNEWKARHPDFLSHMVVKVNIPKE